MNKRIGIVICLLTFLYAPFAEAQTASPHSDLATADWSVKRAHSLNAEPKEAVWKFINDFWPAEQDLGGKLCSFQFADLRHSGKLSLVVSYDNGGQGNCNDVELFDKPPAGLEDYDFNAQNTFYFESIQDLNGDDRYELILDAIFAPGRIDHCTATWPVIYAWNGAGYANVSEEFKGFYRQTLQELTQRLAPSPTPTPVSEQAGTIEILPSKGPGAVRRFIIQPPTAQNSESESSEETSNTGDTDCLKAEAAKIKRYLGISSDAGMLDAIKWKNSDNPDDREFAAMVLADIGTAEAIRDLQTLSRDPDADVAGTAKATLKDVGKPFVYPTIQGELMTKAAGTPSAN